MRMEIAEPARAQTPAAPLNEAELLDALAARRAGAFELLVAMYQDRLYTLAWRITGNGQDAEEAVQEALLRAHRALYGTYSPERVRGLALRPWLTTVLLNTARNMRRGRSFAVSLDALGVDERAAGVRGAAGAVAPPAAAERQELAAALEAALAALSRRRRVAVVLRYVEGFSYEEVAQMLGRPVGTVKSDVHRALRQLRRRLGPLLAEDR